MWYVASSYAPVILRSCPTPPPRPHCPRDSTHSPQQRTPHRCHLIPLYVLCSIARSCTNLDVPKCMVDINIWNAGNAYIFRMAMPSKRDISAPLLLLQRHGLPWHLPTSIMGALHKEATIHDSDLNLPRWNEHNGTDTTQKSRSINKTQSNSSSQIH